MVWFRTFLVWTVRLRTAPPVERAERARRPPRQRRAWGRALFGADGPDAGSQGSRRHPLDRGF